MSGQPSRARHPELWTYGAEGNLLVAHSIRGAVIEPEPLPKTSASHSKALAAGSAKPRSLNLQISSMPPVLDWR